MGQVSKIIPIPNKISDHSIIILKLEVPIKIKDTFKKINILDIEITNKNIEAIKAITREEQNIELKEPSKTITRKRHQIKLTNEDLIQNFEKLKKQEKEKIKELKYKKAQELNLLLNAQSLGKEPYQRMASLMQIDNGITWWKAENDNEKELVINGFKELYRHSNNFNVDTNKIITLMQECK